MCCQTHTFIFLLEALIVVSCDLTFESITQVNEPFKDAPKNWHAYVRSFQLYVISHWNTKLQTTSVQFYWLEQKYLSYHLHHHLSKQTTQLKTFKKNKHRVPTEGHGLLYGYEILRATGLICASCAVEKTFSQSVYYASTITSYWEVNVNSLLALNLTVHDLYLTGGVEDCVMANLTIHNGKSDNRDSLALCGHHSMMHIFPAFQNFTLILKSHFQVFYFLNISFSVLDAHYAKTQQVRNTLTSRFTSNYFFQRNVITSSIFLQVRKRYRLKILSHKNLESSNQTKLLVLDGPGLLSPAVRNNRNIYFASTFQCVFQVIQSGGRIQDLTLQYTEEEYQVKTTLKTPAENGHLFLNDSCYTNVCLVSVVGEPGSHVNVTLMKMSYVGKETDRTTCRYGGLVSTEQNGDSYRESPAICTSHSYLTNTSRSFYSHESSLLLILYFYKAYSVVNATLALHQTTCKSIQINRCDLEKFCHEHMIDRVFCISFLEKLQRSQVSLELKNYDSLHVIEVSLRGDGCVVLQFLNTKDNKTSTRLCSRTVKRRFVSSLFYLETSITGDFQHTYKMVGAFKRDCSDGFIERISIRHRNMLQQLCFTKFHFEGIRCKMFQTDECDHDGFHTESSSTYEATNFYMFMKTKPGTVTCPVSLTLKLFPYAEPGWFDIIIRKESRRSRSLCADSLPLESFYAFDDKSILNSWSTVSKTPFLEHYVFVLSLAQTYQTVQEMKFKINITGRKDVQYPLKCLQNKNMPYDALFMTALATLEFQMVWSDCVHLAKLQTDMNFIAVPVTYGQIHMRLDATTPVTVNSSAEVKLVWIHDNYPHHDKYQSLIKCCSEQINNKTQKLWHMKCLNLSSLNSAKYYQGYFFLKQSRDTESRNAKLYNSNKALSVCTDMEAHLPCFTSHMELHQFITLVKFSKYIPPIEGMFVGWSSNIVHRVSTGLSVTNFLGLKLGM